jgi:hypothetical protein
MFSSHTERKDINLAMLLFIGEWLEFDLEILSEFRAYVFYYINVDDILEKDFLFFSADLSFSGIL